MSYPTTTLELQRIIRDHTPPFGCANDRFLLMELLQYASPPDWKCWAGRERLANRMQVSVKTIERSIGNLERCDWIYVTRQRGESNRYRINVSKILTFASETAVESRPSPKFASSPTKPTTQPQPAASRRSRAVVYSEAKGTPQCSA